MLEPPAGARIRKGKTKIKNKEGAIYAPIAQHERVPVNYFTGLFIYLIKNKIYINIL